MKKFALILLATFALVCCDDYNKRDTPREINFTQWESITKPQPMAEEHIYLKFYESTFDMLHQHFEHGELITTEIQSGQYTYKMPKVRLMFADKVLQGIVAGKHMVLPNYMVLELMDVDAF